MKRGDNMLKIPIIEVTLSLISSWWAIVLFNTPDMFQKSPYIYEFFSSVATEKKWAILFLFGALVKIIGLVFRNRWLRKSGLLISAFIYSLIAASYYLGTGWFSIGFGTFTAIAIMALWGIREVDMRNG